MEQGSKALTMDEGTSVGCSADCSGRFSQTLRMTGMTTRIDTQYKLLYQVDVNFVHAFQPRIRPDGAAEDSGT